MNRKRISDSDNFLRPSQCLSKEQIPFPDLFTAHTKNPNFLIYEVLVPGTVKISSCSIPSLVSKEIPSSKARCFSVLFLPASQFTCLLLATSGSGVPRKAVLLLHPPWSPTFKEETVTLTCMGSNSLEQEVTSWYYNKKSWKMKSKNITTNKSGLYQCKTKRSSLSDPVHLEFSSDWLILQVSHPVFEGDNVFLQCRGRKEKDTSDRTYYKDGKQLHNSRNLDLVTLNSVSRDNSKYHCTAYKTGILKIQWKVSSNPLQIQVQELFLTPVLTTRPSQPVEGGPVTLICETELPAQRADVQLLFCFFRDNQALGSGCSSSPELQIPIIWREDSGSYWCKAEAETRNITKRSPKTQMHIQRVPVSDVNLKVQPPMGQLIEGENLILICSAATGTGSITFSWHKEGKASLGRKTQHSLLAELQVPTVREQVTGRYYCAADNGDGPVLSRWIRVTVRSPVSRPVLTLHVSRAQAAVGDEVELHCEALRGSPPILYRFYHETVILRNSSAPSGEGVSFNFSLTEKHSGNYSCEASNDLGSQSSHKQSLRVIVPVSHPVLTLRASGAQAMVGDMVQLHCETLRGSPPILYQFYHENVTLGKNSAPSGGGVSFNLSLTAEHSGKYSCEAGNGLGAQYSEMITLNVTGVSRSRTGTATAGIVGAILGVLSLAAAVFLLCHFRTQRKSGGLSATRTPSYSYSENQEPSLPWPSSIDLQEPAHSEHLSLMELQPVYSNENSTESNLVYSQLCNIPQAKENPANPSRMHPKDKELIVIYSALKKTNPDDSAKEASRRASNHEDISEDYENVPHAIAALGH